MPLRRAIVNVFGARRDRRREVPPGTSGPVTTDLVTTDPVTTDPGLPHGTARLEDMFAYQEDVRAAAEHRIPAQRRRAD